MLERLRTVEQSVSILFPRTNFPRCEQKERSFDWVDAPLVHTKDELIKILCFGDMKTFVLLFFIGCMLRPFFGFSNGIVFP